MNYRKRRETLCLNCTGVYANMTIIQPHPVGTAAPQWVDYVDARGSTRFVYKESKLHPNNLLHIYVPMPVQAKTPRAPGILSGFLGR